MRSATKAKAVAAAGIAGVVLGAGLMIAPPAAGAAVTLTLNPGGNDNAGCSDLGYDVEARHNVQADPGDSGQASGGGLVYEYDPAVSSASGLVDPRGDEQFSHIAFCAATTTTTTTTEAPTTTTTIDVGGVSTTTEATTTTTESPTTTEAETTTTTAGPAGAETEVLGETVTRTLPRTGTGSQDVAVAGVAMMIFGAILVGGSRRVLTGSG